MEVVRYRPGEAIRWLQTGAELHRKTAHERGRSIVRQTGTEQRPLTQNLKTAASALMEYGKGAYAEMLHHQASASEYILQDEQFDIVSGNSIKSIDYSRVKAVTMRGERAVLTLDKGTLTIKPFAHIVAGRTRVPVGWVRNGTEVPYDLLIEELAARCRLEIEEE